MKQQKSKEWSQTPNGIFSFCQLKELSHPNNGDLFVRRFALKLNWFVFMLNYFALLFLLFWARCNYDLNIKAQQYCALIFLLPFYHDSYCKLCWFTDHSGSLSCWWLAQFSADAKTPLLNTHQLSRDESLMNTNWFMGWRRHRKSA